ncbi:bifunctional alpha,alpha-trehalose-phosphate synthase (UDP-forming)/trehalose-phosphatase [bacterium]|nr:bifunctional alpha,alpha-trehalose-phosphate synthase (UDP-forming)/trehalose-phosphatase [bacterium]
MRLVIVSNRLPVCAQTLGQGFTFVRSVGGLATGLKTFLDTATDSLETLWVGWPGITVSEVDKQKVISELQRLGSYPVFLSEDEMENFYHGFCNKTIWALFHYFPSYAVYDQRYWHHYKKVNERFCQVLKDVIRPDDMIWIHDYHLMLLPYLLREYLPAGRIGFFLHIPFPSYEVFRLLPSKWRVELLQGLLGADLIGFHTHDYVQHFLKCTSRILGHESNMGEIFFGNRPLKADSFPMGIDYAKFQKAATEAENSQEQSMLKSNFVDKKVVLSIDRLDYSKGILHRLRGYETFLQNNSEWHQKVVLLLVVVPSRIGVEHYQIMKKQIDEIVGKINGKYGSVTWSPIIYQYRSLALEPLVNLYTISDVILVTPLRDGMNLIAKEYIACRVDQSGVLILSEMAGASSELRESMIINPNNVDEIAESLKEALKMPTEEQVRRNQAMQARLQRYDITRWATDFIQSLDVLKANQESSRIHLLDAENKNELLSHVLSAKRRLIFLDYDGTLVPFDTDPAAVSPSKDLVKSLGALTEIKDTKVVLISGRKRETMQHWFGELSIALAAEHGAWIRENGDLWRMLQPVPNEWKPELYPIFQTYSDKLPGSFLEEKDFSLAYHYRAADPELAALRVSELGQLVMRLCAGLNIQLLYGNKVLEARSTEINKGNVARYFLNSYPCDSILALGDDRTDEDLFRVLPDSAHSIKVGRAPSHAKFNLRSHLDARELIQDLIKKSQGTPYKLGD